MKAGELILPDYRAWIRAQPCSHCGRPAPSEMHHFPTRAALGVIVDIKSAPLCLECHKRAGGEVVWLASRRLQPIDAKLQGEYVERTWLRFVETAPAVVVDRVMTSVIAWRYRREERGIPW